MKSTHHFLYKTKVLALCVVLIVATCQKGSSQIVSASNTDNTTYTNVPPMALNSATIYYPPSCPTCGVASQLRAVVYAGLASTLTMPATPYMTVEDGYSSVTVLVPHNGSTGPITHFIDVVIGNNTSNTSDYKIAVAWADGTCVNLDIFDVTGVGSSLTVTYNSTGCIGTTGSQVPVNMDIIADYQNLIGGLPTCDKFVVTWSGFIYNGPGDEQYAYYASINNPFSGTTRIVGSDILYADVAAIRRTVSHSIHDLALFCYMDDVYDNLYYMEWDITANTISTPVYIDNISTWSPASVEPARIAAIDDYNINNPGAVSPLAYYCVSYMNDLSGSDIWVSNNLLSSPVDISSAYLSSYYNYSPCITYGMCGDYSVGYYTADGNDDMYVQDIDQTTGALASSDVYEVNYTGINNSTPYNISVSSTSNVTSGAPFLLCNWLTLNSITGDYEVHEKMADCGLAFKHAPVSVVKTSNKDMMTLYPNPSSGKTTLSFNLNKDADVKVILTDMLGRQINIVANKPMPAGDDNIEISTADLTSGIYNVLIQIGNDSYVKPLSVLR
jgi:hypothetical protein